MPVTGSAGPASVSPSATLHDQHAPTESLSRRFHRIHLLTPPNSDLPSATSPYVSVVVATRNDDHGGDPLKRLQAFINTFSAQCRRASLDAEVIVVEWNPPSDRPRVSELCRVPPDAPFPVRFVEVPAEIHQQLRFSSVLPLFQMIAKNAGIRRARGRFVLATNIDIIFSNELVEQLASGRLVPGRMYRVDRHDIESNFPVEAALTEQMTFCQTHQIRVHALSGTHPVDPLGRLRTLDADIVGSAVFRLGRGWHTREGDHEQGFFRWAGQEASFTIDRTAGQNLVHGAVLDVELEPNPYQPGSWVDVEIVDGERRLTQRRVSQRTRLRVPLDDGVAHHEIVIRTLDSSGGRQWLPLFESRAPLCCRVWHINVGSAPSHQYDIGSVAGHPGRSPGLIVQHTPSGVEITTDPGGYSYCAQYGPFAAPVDGSYEFLIEYVPIEGRLAFTAMDDERSSWLPAKVVEMEGDGIRLVSLAVDLRRGAKFSLYVSNYLPDGGVSRFVLRRLLGSVALEQLRGTPRASNRRARHAPCRQRSREVHRAVPPEGDVGLAGRATSRAGSQDRGAGAAGGAGPVRPVATESTGRSDFTRTRAAISS